MNNRSKLFGFLAKTRYYSSSCVVSDLWYPYPCAVNAKCVTLNYAVIPKWVAMCVYFNLKGIINWLLWLFISTERKLRIIMFRNVARASNINNASPRLQINQVDMNQLSYRTYEYNWQQFLIAERSTTKSIFDFMHESCSFIFFEVPKSCTWHVPFFLL